MISKSDIILLLEELSESGVDTQAQESMVMAQSTVSIDALKFINEHKPLDLVRFYEKLRKSYNHKSSKLYGNIVKCDEVYNLDAKTVTTTLSSLLNQILLFETDDKEMFFKHARCEEILMAISVYVKTKKLDAALKLLKLIKADLIVSEYINGRRK